MAKASAPVGAVSVTAGRCRATRAEGAPARGSPRTATNRTPAARTKAAAAPTATGGFFNVARTASRPRRERSSGGRPAAAARADWRLANMDRAALERR
ncbi:hypothetical protein D3C75_802700 [compost metagenome]